MRKITVTLEESLIDALSKTALQTGLKKSRIIRDALKKHLAILQKESAKREWLEKNRLSMEAYNRRIEDEGIFAEEFRRF
ncbi:hypothetical protein NNO_0187 [Hydrogenimonas sp.]|nr:hypothetical protein NNO_0187 [Hydrogenimonas sp.]